MKRTERLAWAATGFLLATILTMIGLAPPEVQNFGKVLRARGFEVWDQDNRTVRLDVADAVDRLAHRLDVAEKGIDLAYGLAYKVYQTSPAKADDEASARESVKAEAAAQRLAAEQAMLDELQLLRRQLAEAARQAQNEAERDRIDAMIQDSHRQMSADELAREMKKIRRVLEKP